MVSGPKFNCSKRLILNFVAFGGLVQTQVTLGGVKLSAPWPEDLAQASVVAGLARPYIDKSVTLAPSDLNQA